jgi:ADP-ribose pyrophosphatase
MGNYSAREERPWSATFARTLLTNPYFSVALQDVTVTDGSRRDYYTIHFPAPAVGIVVRRGNDILLVRQYRFIVDEFVWAIPSGAATQGESALEAAMRELLEETGYSCAGLRPLLTCYASYGCSDQRFDIFFGEDPVQTKTVFDVNEVIETKWFSPEELLALIDRNGVVDNLSLSPLLYVLLGDTRK